MLLKVWIINPELAALADSESEVSFSLVNPNIDMSYQGWYELREIEIPFDLSEVQKVLHPAALEGLDAKEAEVIEEYNQKMARIKEARSKLTAITHQV